MDGFLGTRGSLMLDIVFLTMMLVLPILAVSRFLVRRRGKHELHRRIQITLAWVLLIAVVAFEVDVRVFGWRERAMPSPYWVDGALNDWIDWSLIVHLCFAIPTPFIWGGLIWAALRGFPKPTRPGPHSARHRFWGTIAMVMMAMTSVTGWVFYWLAFAATAG